MNNRVILYTFVLAVVLAATIACSKAGMPSNSAPDGIFNSTGIIKAIDAATSKVTIDHQEIPGYMAAMEMTFTASNATVYEGIAVGDKVAFVLERKDGKMLLTRMSKMVETVAANGAELYAANCAICHGLQGQGDKRGIPLVSSHALGHSEEEYVNQVMNGTPGKMLPFREKLNDEQVAAIVKHVRTVIQADIKPEQREHKH